MRKSELHFLLLAVCFSLFPVFLNAQADTWARSFGSKLSEIPGALITDDQGYIYVAGNYKDSLHIGNVVLPCRGGNDYFVAKFKPNGDLVWASRFGDESSEYVYDIALDGIGGLFVAGNFQDSTDFGTEKIFTNYQGGNFDMFVMRMDTMGNYIHNKASKGPAGEFPTSMDVNSRGEAFVTGYFRQWSFFFGQPDTIRAANFNDMFIFKVDTNRHILFYESAGGEFYDSGSDIKVYHDSILFITGYFQDTAYFNDSSFNLKSAGTGEQLFISEYDWNGNFKWAKKANSPTWAIPYSMDIDAAGNMYIGGIYDSVLTMGSHTITTNGELDGFLLKTDKTGNALWLKTIGGTGYDGLKGVTVSPSGNVYVTGSFQDVLYLGGDTLLAEDEFDSQAWFAGFDAAGNVLWTNSGGGVSLDEGYLITSDPSDYAISMGTFIDDASFGQANLTSYGSDDFYLIKMNSSGSVDRFNALPEVNLDLLAFPNPTSRFTNLVFELPKPGNLDISLLDLSGRTVRNWAENKTFGAGRNEIQADLSGLQGGMYIYRLVYQDQVFSGKLILNP
ncbi:MAG: T9SS type A sorting domain-containing protein [Bacteroidia bacterium]|nr:T9SS type A sorting domain-containing protein [Bacteroidia bacterium]